MIDIVIDYLHSTGATMVTREDCVFVLIESHKRLRTINQDIHHDIRTMPAWKLWLVKQLNLSGYPNGNK